MKPIEQQILAAVAADLVAYSQRQWWPDGQRYGSYEMYDWRRAITYAREDAVRLDFRRWQIEDDSPRGRKRRSLAMKSLEEAGYIVRLNEGGRTVAIQLTELGKRAAKQLRETSP